MYASYSEMSIDGNTTFANNKVGESGGEKGRGMDIVGSEVHVTTGVVVLTCRKTTPKWEVINTKRKTPVLGVLAKVISFITRGE